MTALAELVGALSGLEVAGLLVLSVVLALWPAAFLAGGRDTRPAVNRPPSRPVSYRPGRAVVLAAPGVLDATLVDAFPGRSW